MDDAVMEEAMTTEPTLVENPTTETFTREISSVCEQTDKDDELVVGEVLENVIANSILDIQTDLPDLIPDNNSSPPIDFLDYGDDDDDDILKENLATVPQDVATIETDNCTVTDTNGVDQPTEPENEQEEIEYIVEKILDKKIDPRGLVKYLVKWQNFSSKDNSWEPLEHLVECDKAMQDFEISRALKLAERHNNIQVDSNGNEKAHQAPLKRRITPSSHKEFEVNDVMGLTLVNNEKYFLISLANSTQKAFIRASLANTVFPSKVIDFYIKNLRWKTRVDD